MATSDLVAAPLVSTPFVHLPLPVPTTTHTRLTLTRMRSVQKCTQRGARPRHAGWQRLRPLQPAVVAESPKDMARHAQNEVHPRKSFVRSSVRPSVRPFVRSFVRIRRATYQKRLAPSLAETRHVPASIFDGLTRPSWRPARPCTRRARPPTPSASPCSGCRPCGGCTTCRSTRSCRGGCRT